MLVLTRRLNEKILLPAIEASFEVLDIRGDRVRLGISAPTDVAILREEVVKRDGLREPIGAMDSARASLRRQRHQLRNQLNFASVGLALAQRQLQAGLIENLEATLEKLSNGFQQIGQSVDQLSGEGRHKPEPKKHLRALVVEDDHNECELLAGFFRLAGYQVATAGDGADAMDYLRAHQAPDVMLLDMMLPRLDGPATVRMVRQQPELASLKIVAVSGYTPDQLGLDCVSAGIDRWFQKPLNPELLLKELTAPSPMSVG